MVLCFFSSSLFLGPNRAVRTAGAFWPSLVLTIAFWNAMIPTLVGGVAEAEVCGGAPVWAWDSSAAPRAMAGKKTQFFVKLKLLDFVSILTYATGRIEAALQNVRPMVKRNRSCCSRNG